MIPPVASSARPARVYPLYLPGFLKVVVFFMLAAFTLFGVLMVFGIFPEPQSRMVGLLWFGVVGALWFKVLTLPYRIEVGPDGGITFVSLLRRFQLWPSAVESIKPTGGRLGFFVLKHREGRIQFVGQFDGFHEFLFALKNANPGVELRGC